MANQLTLYVPPNERGREGGRERERELTAQFRDDGSSLVESSQLVTFIR